MHKQKYSVCDVFAHKPLYQKQNELYDYVNAMCHQTGFTKTR